MKKLLTGSVDETSLTDNAMLGKNCRVFVTSLSALTGITPVLDFPLLLGCASDASYISVKVCLQYFLNISFMPISEDERNALLVVYTTER